MHMTGTPINTRVSPVLLADGAFQRALTYFSTAFHAAIRLNSYHLVFTVAIRNIIIYLYMPMAKKTVIKSPPPATEMGRPSEYDPKYCDMLIDHMKQGGTFESFAAKLRHSKQTLYNWTSVYPDFLDAKKIGEGMSLDFFLNMGKLMATGQLRRVKSEKPVILEGKVQFDKDGNVVMEREYEYSTGGQSTWIFMMKNIHRWKDRTDVNVAGQLPDTPGGSAPPPVTFDFSGMSKEQLEIRMNELMIKAMSPEKKK